MADTKISNLPSKSVPVYADVLPIVDSVGTITKKVGFRALWEGADTRYISPSFTYDIDGILTRIDYADTSYKEFTYTGDKLTRIDFHVFGIVPIKRKTFIYSGDTLTQITETTV